MAGLPVGTTYIISITVNKDRVAQSITGFLLHQHIRILQVILVIV